MAKETLVYHLDNACKYRVYVCDHCNDIVYWKDKKEHNAVCKCWPVNCQNFCGQIVERGKMDEHVAVCGMSVLPCDYTAYGCTFQGTQEERVQHDMHEASHHLELAVERIRVLEREQDEQMDTVRDHLKLAVDNIKALQKELEGKKKELYMQKGVNRVLWEQYCRRVRASVTEDENMEDYENRVTDSEGEMPGVSQPPWIQKVVGEDGGKSFDDGISDGDNDDASVVSDITSTTCAGRSASTSTLNFGVVYPRKKDGVMYPRKKET